MDDTGPEAFFDCDDTKNAAGMKTPCKKVPSWGGRTQLPAKMASRSDYSIWTVLKQCIGKELSKITMPLVFNEPISFLQRLVEHMEYAYLIEQASRCDDPVKRFELVTAFAVSASASTKDRVGKPFNPLLGETYEYSRGGYRMVCEQVSHHPPISAFHASSDTFLFYGFIQPQLKFWGRSVEVTPGGLITLRLTNYDESYTWQSVNCSVHNIVIGKLWLEQQGSMVIMNHKTSWKATLTFHPAGWFSKNIHRVDGILLDAKNRKLRCFGGRWVDALYSFPLDQWEAFVSLASSRASDDDLLGGADDDDADGADDDALKRGAIDNINNSLGENADDGGGDGNDGGGDDDDGGGNDDDAGWSDDDDDDEFVIANEDMCSSGNDYGDDNDKDNCDDDKGNDDNDDVKNDNDDNDGVKNDNDDNDDVKNDNDDNDDVKNNNNNNSAYDSNNKNNKGGDDDGHNGKDDNDTAKKTNGKSRVHAKETKTTTTTATKATPTTTTTTTSTTKPTTTTITTTTTTKSTTTTTPSSKSAAVASASSTDQFQKAVKGSVKLWQTFSRPTMSEQYYSFTSFTMHLNEEPSTNPTPTATTTTKPTHHPSLAPTDCRFRPDIRLMEQGFIEQASVEKNRLEEKQREVRKKRRKSQPQADPSWFHKGLDSTTNKQGWLFNGRYFKREWSKCPDIF